MPTYVYENCFCGDDALKQEHPEINWDSATVFETFELNVPISQRDTVRCGNCGNLLKRKIAFTGLTWAPTAGGMR